MVTDDSILGVKVAFFCTPLVTNVAKVIVAIVVVSCFYSVDYFIVSPVVVLNSFQP